MSKYIACDRCDFSSGDGIGESYIVDKILGEGTFGRVYKIHDRQGRIYALKLLKLWEEVANAREILMKRFEMEYEAGRINSNYLVTSLDKGTVKGNPYIVMEYCPGGDLTSKIGQIDSSSLVNTSTEVLYGLSDLHKHGKVHRDLKPENVLLKSNGHAVLTDFGISGDQNKRLTEKGITGIPKDRFGTFAYMPPEQINPPRGNATVLPTTDIFSFGVMTYQLLTGCLPFGNLECESDLPQYIERGNRGRWNRNVIEQNILTQEWMPLLEGCLVPDYKKRLQDVQEVISLLPQKANQKAYIKSEFNISFSTDTSFGIMLRVMQGEEYGRIYMLERLRYRAGSPRNIITIGREDIGIHNEINIKETVSFYISRRHCTLENDVSNGHWFIRDGQWYNNQWNRSLNRTFVNSTEVSERGYYIQPGDIITIGDVKMRVEGARDMWWKAPTDT